MQYKYILDKTKKKYYEIIINQCPRHRRNLKPNEAYH